MVLLLAYLFIPQAILQLMLFSLGVNLNEIWAIAYSFLYSVKDLIDSHVLYYGESGRKLFFMQIIQNAETKCSRNPISLRLVFSVKYKIK